MAQQKSKTMNTDSPQANNLWARWWPFIIAVLVIVGLPITVAMMKHQWPRQPAANHFNAGATQAAPVAPTPPLSAQAIKDTAWDSAWPPLPSEGTPAQPLEQVRALYAFAARHPEVLQYAPCYCGCESGGHQSARDCFVKGRTADGKPQWDGMGFI